MGVTKTASVTLHKVLKMLTGEYSVTETVSGTGMRISASVRFDDGMKAHGAITGPITFRCQDESYTIASDGTISITNIDNRGDCIHDNMSKYDLTLKEAKYSSDSDTITVSVYWNFF